MSRYIWVVLLALFIPRDMSETGLPEKKLTLAERVIMAVEVWSEYYGVDKWLVYAVMKVENDDLDTALVYKHGEIGLMQILPRNVEHPESLFIPEYNIREGIRLIREALDKGSIGWYNGNPRSKKVKRYIKRVMRFYQWKAVPEGLIRRLL